MRKIKKYKVKIKEEKKRRNQKIKKRKEKKRKEINRVVRKESESIIENFQLIDRL
jgi:hypothetical protein